MRLVVAYDGTHFAGWQRQPRDTTVQVVVEDAIEHLAGARCKVRGASRTDAGVHAHGQVAAFDSPREIAPHGWQRGLNSKLPPGVAVVRAEPCAVGYNPRYDALAKTYRYLLHLGPVRDPFLRGRAWHLGPRRSQPLRRRPAKPEEWLDVDAMREAAGRLVGEHDFVAFKTAADPRPTTVRTLTRVEVFPFAGRTDLLAIEIRGTAFMHNMVRILVGTLVEVGRKRRTPDELSALLGPRGRREDAGETAPPQGLYLVEVELGRKERAEERGREEQARGEGAPEALEPLREAKPLPS